MTFPGRSGLRVGGEDLSPELKPQSHHRVGRQSSVSRWQEWTPKVVFLFKDAGTSIWKPEGWRSRLPIPHALWLC